MLAREMLKKSRKDRGLTLAEAATDLGMTPSNLYGIENDDHRQFRPETLTKMAIYYCLPIDRLLLSANLLPMDISDKIIRHPELLQLIRDHPT